MDMKKAQISTGAATSFPKVPPYETVSLGGRLIVALLVKIKMIDR